MYQEMEKENKRWAKLKTYNEEYWKFSDLKYLPFFIFVSSLKFSTVMTTDIILGISKTH